MDQQQLLNREAEWEEARAWVRRQNYKRAQRDAKRKTQTQASHRQQMQTKIDSQLAELIKREPHAYSDRMHKLYQTHKRLENYNALRPYLFRIGR